MVRGMVCVSTYVNYFKNKSSIYVNSSEGGSFHHVMSCTCPPTYAGR